MKALVTGASGFTGSHLVKTLERCGHHTIAFIRSTSPLARLTGTQAELVRGDLCDRERLETAMAGVDVVFHVAAYVELGIVDAAEMERVNVAGTQTVLDAARAAGVGKVVYCSTVGVFGDTRGQIADETYQRQQQDFSSPYDRTKLLAQERVDRAAASGLDVVSILPAGIFGPDDPHFGRLVRWFFLGKLPFLAGGDRPTGIVHVDDLAELMLAASERSPAGERYIASAGERTVREMFALLSPLVERPVPPEAPRWLIRCLGNVLDPWGRALNWQPPLSRERVHYFYDRCVRVDASKACCELHWQPRSPDRIIQEIGATVAGELGRPVPPSFQV